MWPPYQNPRLLGRTRPGSKCVCVCVCSCAFESEEHCGKRCFPFAYPRPTAFNSDIIHCDKPLPHSPRSRLFIPSFFGSPFYCQVRMLQRGTCSQGSKVTISLQGALPSFNLTRVIPHDATFPAIYWANSNIANTPIAVRVWGRSFEDHWQS